MFDLTAACEAIILKRKS